MEEDDEGSGLQLDKKMMGRRKKNRGGKGNLKKMREKR